jgi:hypothetical protein
MFIDQLTSTPKLLRSETSRIPNGPIKDFAPTELNPPCLEILNDFSGCVGSWSARDSTTRVRAGATKIESLDRSSLLRPANQRAKREELVEGLLAMMNMTPTQSIGLFKIERRNNLAS